MDFYINRGEIMHTKKIFLRILLMSIILLGLFWAASIINCEILTDKYGEEFLDASINLRNTIKIDAWKVLDYSEDYAEVYFYTEYGGALISFDFVDGEWKERNWKASWSTTGSADDFIWPYIH
jgi:hypothetical protein